MGKKAELFVFGDLPAEEVAEALVSQHANSLGLLETLTPYTYVPVEGSDTYTQDKGQAEVEEGIKAIIEAGHGILFVGVHEWDGANWIKRALGMSKVKKDMPIVVVCGATQGLWQKALDTLQEHGLQKEEVQWVTSISLHKLHTQHGEEVEVDGEEVGIDLDACLRLVQDNVRHVVELSCGGSVERMAYRERLGIDEEKEKQAGKVALESIRNALMEKVMRFDFGEVMSNGFVKVTNQEAVKELIDGFVGVGGGLIITGETHKEQEDCMVTYLPKDRGTGLHAMVGRPLDVNRLYETYEDFPCMPVEVAEEASYGGALDGVKELCSHISGVQVDAQNYWEITSLWGAKFLDKDAKEVGGIITIEEEEYEKVARSVRGQLREMKGGNDKPAVALVGAIESMLLVVGKQGEVELVGLPAMIMERLKRHIGK